MNQNSCHDLRMFVSDQLRNRQRVHPLQTLNPGYISTLQYSVNQKRCFVVPQRELQYRSNVFTRVGDHQALRSGHSSELVNNVINTLSGNLCCLGDSLTQFLNLFGRQMLKNLRCLCFAQRHHQNCRVLKSIVVCHSAILRSALSRRLTVHPCFDDICHCSGVIPGQFAGIVQHHFTAAGLTRLQAPARRQQLWPL